MMDPSKVEPDGQYDLPINNFDCPYLYHTTHMNHHTVEGKKVGWEHFSLYYCDLSCLNISRVLIKFYCCWFYFSLSWEVQLLSHLDQMKSMMRQIKWRMENHVMMISLQGKKSRTFIPIIVVVVMERVRHVNVAKELYPWDTQENWVGIAGQLDVSVVFLFKEKTPTRVRLWSSLT